MNDVLYQLSQQTNYLIILQQLNSKINKIFIRERNKSISKAWTLEKKRQKKEYNFNGRFIVSGNDDKQEHPFHPFMSQYIIGHGTTGNLGEISEKMWYRASYTATFISFPLACIHSVYTTLQPFLKQRKKSQTKILQ